MKDHLEQTLPFAGESTEHQPAWSGSASADGGDALVWKAEIVLPADSRIVPETKDIPKAVLEPAPAQLEEVPLAYGLVAKVLLPRPAFNFKVEHDLPPNVTLLEAKPRATIVGEHLIWNFGRLDPGQELRLQVVVLPEPGTKFTVGELTNFNATYTQNLYFQTPLIRAKLAVKITGPEFIRVGELAEYVIETQNAGNWVVENITTGLVLPPELLGADGLAPNFTIGSLDPGSSRKVKVFAKAAKGGEARLKVEVNGTDDAKSSAEFVTTVLG
ncbi:COG1361 family protein [Zavarzinella formosa]|uniref:hypothetical protein n=1 Tax=Zavarzinella formosa TaxID=360055 RepID=UPI0002E3E64F|nr:hypothetical protein [Zavarzinella formosa]